MIQDDGPELILKNCENAGRFRDCAGRFRNCEKTPHLSSFIQISVAEYSFDLDRTQPYISRYVGQCFELTTVTWAVFWQNAACTVRVLRVGPASLTTRACLPGFPIQRKEH